MVCVVLAYGFSSFSTLQPERVKITLAFSQKKRAKCVSQYLQYCSRKRDEGNGRTPQDHLMPPLLWRSKPVFGRIPPHQSWISIISDLSHYPEVSWLNGWSAHRWCWRFWVQNTAYAWDFSKHLSRHPAVNGYLVLFRAGEGEDGEEEEWCQVGSLAASPAIN